MFSSHFPKPAACRSIHSSILRGLVALLLATIVSRADAANVAPSFVLPAGTPVAVGETWTERGGDQYYRSIALSADGKKQAALTGNYIVMSKDYGVTWNNPIGGGPLLTYSNFMSITSSADGTKLVAVAGGGYNDPADRIYTSTDSGTTWTARESARRWRSVASSTDGAKLVAVVEGGQIYTSTDSGVTWTARDSNRDWVAVASSADGTKLVAAVSGPSGAGRIYTSSDSGETWNARASNRIWRSVTSSADGTKLAAVASGQNSDFIYTSPDSGATWTARESSRWWSAITSSADGTHLAATDQLGPNFVGGQIHVSADSGQTWVARASNRPRTCISFSADGSQLTAGGDRLHTSAASITPYAIAVPVNSGAYSATSLASSILAGPPDEDGQAVDFTVTNSNNALFTTQPALAANGTLTFTPGGAGGTATVTVVAHDDGGTTGGGVDTSEAQVFTITLFEAPTITAIDDVQTNEDTSTGPLAFTISSSRPGVTPTLSATSGNTTLVPNANIILGGSSADRTVTITPAANQSGSALITVQISDGVLTSSETFTVTVHPANDAPGFALATGGPIIITASSGPFTAAAFATNILAGPADESGQAVTFTVSNNNNALFVIQPGISANGTLTLTPGAAAGTAIVTVIAHDDGGTANGGVDASVAKTFTITVNEPPTISAIADVTINEGAATSALNFTISDPDAGATFSVSATSGNTTLVPAANIVLGGSGANRTITVTPAADRSGSALITVWVSDGWLTASGAFTLTVNPVNDMPSFTLPLGAITGTAGATWTAHNSGDQYAIASSEDGSKLAAAGWPGLIYTSTDFGVTWTARNSGHRDWAAIASSADGAKLAAVDSDDEGQIYTSTDSGVTWTARNSGNHYWLSIASSADGTKLAAGDEEGQIYTSTDSGVTWTAQNSGNRYWYSIASSADGTKLAAVDGYGFDYTGGQIYTSTDSGVTWTAQNSGNHRWRSIATSADGTKLAAVDANGGQIHTSTDSGVTWTAQNSGHHYWYSIASSADGTRLAAVSEDGIHTSEGPREPYVVTVGASSGPFTAAAFATNILAGPADESGQAVAFTVSNNNNALFVIQPGISANGTLTLTPGATAGTAIVTVIAHDDGGTANGGVDASVAKTFTITVNEPPTISVIADVTINEGAATSALNFTIGDTDAGATFSVSATSGNTTLVPAANIVLGGSGANRTITVTPAADRSGSALITVWVSDGWLTASGAFTLTVNPVNDMPSFTLPLGATGAAGATWTAHNPAQSSDNQYWRAIASSADGSKLAATGWPGLIYTSTDFGVTWTARNSGYRGWAAIASSADGSKLAAVDGNAGQIYTSTDSGVTWTARNSGNRYWYSIASSADGSKLAAVDNNGGRIYTSTDSGVTWTARNSGNRDWSAIASSADGTRLAAADTWGGGDGNGGQIYTSTDAGVTWTAQNSGNHHWSSIASSADGTRLAAADTLGGGDGNGGQIYTSTDSGVTWTAQNSGIHRWRSIASSADGAKLAAVDIDKGQIYTSTDSGVTWTAQNSGNNYWYSIASSADGTRLAAMSRDGIHTSEGPLEPYVVTVGANTGIATIPAVAANISAGPPDESGQAVSFTVTNDNNGLFTVQPAISANGTLTFTPARTGNGSATVTVVAHDNGGTANGGIDTSAAQTFTIVITPVDPSFNLSVTGQVTSTALQADGKLIVAGNFTGIGGVARHGIARLNADDSVDLGFDPNANGSVNSILVLESGEIIIGGSFTQLQPNGAAAPSVRNRIALLNSDGAVDAAFNPNLDGPVYSLALQADGRILVGGSFDTAGVTTRHRLARLTAAGVVDAFDPNLSSTADASAAVRCIAVQADGAIVAGGEFTLAGAVTRNYLARFSSSGVLDSAFNPDPDGAVHAVSVLPNGKLVIGGLFQNFTGIVSAHAHLAQLDSDGSVDTTFEAFTSAAAGDAVASISPQANGQLLIGGQFTQCNGLPRNNLARLNSGGTLDEAPDVSVSGFVHSIMIQEDGGIIIGGSFGSVAGVARGNLARLTNDAAAQSLAPLDFTSVEWLRGGACAEAAEVSFDVSTDGGDTFTPLTGTVTRSAGGWKLTGASISPIGGILRGRARVFSGEGNGSGGWVSFQAPYSPGAAKIVVEQPENHELADGETINLGTLGLSVANPVVFTIRNAGGQNLTGLAVTVTGTHAAMFTVATTAQPAGSIEPLDSTTFTVLAKVTTAGTKTATLHITSSDTVTGPFDITLNATGATAVPPTATTGAATGLDFDLSGTGTDIARATLNGVINAKGQARTVAFEYGLTTTYDQSVTLDDIYSASISTSVSAQLEGLRPHTLYHYRVRIDGPLGNALGLDKTFTTADHAPVAVDDAAFALASAAVTIDVLSNDTDADGDALTVAIKTAATPSTAGTVTLVANQFVFTAKAGFGTASNATASFTYTVSDGHGGSDIGLVTITAGSAQIDPSLKSIAAAGNAFESPNSYPVTVTTSGAWAVTEAVAWASVSPMSGNGNGTAKVTVQPNATTSQRIGVIKIAGIDHTIIQAGAAKAALDATALPNGTIVNAIVGGYFELDIPTINAPVTYTVSGLPPGLTLSNSTGILSGRPTMAGTLAKDYSVTVKAKNAAGPLTGDTAGLAAATLTFTIHVVPLPAGAVGTFNGLIARSSGVKLGAIANLGARWQMTSTALGAVSGKIIEGATSKSFTGQLNASADDADHPTLTAAIPGTALTLDIKLDAANDSLTANVTDNNLHDAGGANSAVVSGWGNAWSKAAPVNPASRFKAQHNFRIANAATTDTTNTAAPDGDGFGSFIVTEGTGALSITGLLPDGSVILCATFIGQHGEVLLYNALHGNKGSLHGQLTVTPDNAPNDNIVSGALTWLKPALPATDKDKAYAAGFGPLALAAEGSTYIAPAKGQRVLGLAAPAATPATATNASLSFSLGGLDLATPSSVEFSQAIRIANPSITGLTNKATVAPFNAAVNPNPNPNKVAITTFTAPTGLFAGSCILPGAPARTAPFFGQIVRIFGLTNSTQGYGFFLLPQVPTDTQTVTTSPKLSGAVELTP